MYFDLLFESIVNDSDFKMYLNKIYQNIFTVLLSVEFNLIDGFFLICHHAQYTYCNRF